MVGESLATLHLSVIHMRAVAAAQIFDDELSMHVHNLRVISADGSIFQNDLAMRMPTEHGSIGLHLDQLARVLPFEHFQDSHDENSS